MIQSSQPPDQLVVPLPSCRQRLWQRSMPDSSTSRRCRSPLLAGLLLVISLVGCGRQPSSRDFDPNHRQWEFATGNGAAEGLLFQLPQGFRGYPWQRSEQAVYRGYRPQDYRPQGEASGTASRGIDLIVRPLPARQESGQLTPEALVAMFVVGYRLGECSSGFEAKKLGPLTDPARPGFAALLTCGRTRQGVSDTTLVVGMMGQTHAFQLTWFERGKPQSGTLPDDVGRWSGRLKGLGPRLCPAESMGVTPGGPSRSCLVQALP